MIVFDLSIKQPRQNQPVNSSTDLISSDESELRNDYEAWAMRVKSPPQGDRIRQYIAATSRQRRPSDECKEHQLAHRKSELTTSRGLHISSVAARAGQFALRFIFAYNHPRSLADFNLSYR